MKEEGPRLGYQKYADAITTDTRRRLRHQGQGAARRNPEAARRPAGRRRPGRGVHRSRTAPISKASSAACRARANSTSRTSSGRRAPRRCSTPASTTPTRSRRNCFRKQAKANPQIFYCRRPARTIREVYKALVAKHDGIVAAREPAPTEFAAQQLAADPASKWPTDAVPSRFSKADMSFTSLFSTERPTACRAADRHEPRNRSSTPARRRRSAVAVAAGADAGDTPPSLAAIACGDDGTGRSAIRRRCRAPLRAAGPRSRQRRARTGRPCSGRHRAAARRRRRHAAGARADDAGPQRATAPSSPSSTASTERVNGASTNRVNRSLSLAG